REAAGDVVGREQIEVCPDVVTKRGFPRSAAKALGQARQDDAECCHVWFDPQITLMAQMQSPAAGRTAVALRGSAAPAGHPDGLVLKIKNLRHPRNLRIPPSA